MRYLALLIISSIILGSVLLSRDGTIPDRWFGNKNVTDVYYKVADLQAILEAQTRLLKSISENLSKIVELMEDNDQYHFRDVMQKEDPQVVMLDSKKSG